MAERRMISKSVVCTDKFLAMSSNARALYLHMVVCADDDGFVDSLKGIMVLCGTNSKSLAQLVKNEYVYIFPSGVAVIVHWPMQNKVARDRYKPTIYTEEMSRLSVNSKGMYGVYD